jgi:hypothetical protein
MPQIIGICGFIGSGKDTVADYLVNLHQFRRESFASSLKDAVSHIFGWDRQMLEGRTKHSREWREQSDQWWSSRLGMNITPRWVLQYWGTEVARKAFHDDIWIASLENRLRNTEDDVVITDCRFLNEITALRRVGGKIIRTNRGPQPVWYNTAVAANRGENWAKQELKLQDIHESETSWVGTVFDFELDNNGTLDELYQQIETYLFKSRAQDLPAATPNLL